MPQRPRSEPAGPTAEPVSAGGVGAQPNPTRTRHHLIDFVVAGSAIAISIISLAVAIGQGKTMQKQVAAASWPLLQFTSDNTGPDNKLRITLSIENDGVGPAIVKRFAVNYLGKSYTNQYDLLRDCCGYVVTSDDPTNISPGTPLTRTVERQVIRAGESIPYVDMNYSAENAQVWRKLDRARFKLRFDTCYCSVLDECWSSDLIGVEPRPVTTCPPPKESN